MPVAAAAALAFLWPATVRAQLLETETARPLGNGGLELHSNLEYQFSSEGHELAVPLAFEYGLSDRLELLVEPVAYTAVRPHTGPQATGGGDVEATVTYLIHRETEGAPAFALAAEVKFPTTKDTLIGTGKTDYTGYLIASRRFGSLDVHGNLAYTVVGKPSGAALKNIFSAAFALERQLGASTELFGEVVGNTAAAASSETSGGPGSEASTPEAPSGEVVASVGLAQFVSHACRLALGFSVDNSGAVLVRPTVSFLHRASGQRREVD